MTFLKKKISVFPDAVLPLSGTEKLTVIQNGENRNVAVPDIASSQGQIVDIYAGTNINIDKTDPFNPIINAIVNNTGSGKYTISGGAIWSGSGLTYDVSKLTYYFNGNKTANATSVTLAASDPTYNRLDALVVDELGNVTVITGTASASPITPAIPVDKLLVQFILVEAASVTPAITEEDIYLDNAEWTGSNYTTSGTMVGTTNFDATNTPKQGTKCVDNSLDGRTGILFTRGTTFDISAFTTFSIWVRFTAAQSNKMKLLIRFKDGSLNDIGNEIDLFNYGIDKSITGSWQLAIVPVSLFGGITTTQALRMILTGGSNGTQIEWDVDYITLTNGSVPIIASPTISFYKDSVLIADQKGLDIIVGAGMSVTAAEDAAAGTVKYTLSATGTASPDATPTVKGILKLAGDLGGTADLPTVPGLANKLDISAYNDRFKGKYTSLAALQAAYPTANAGDYGQVDAGAGSNVVNYNYDTDDGWVVGAPGSGASNTDGLPEGATNLYFTTARVLATVLSGLSVATGGDIVATDTILAAFGRIQKRFTDLLTTFNGANQLVKLDGTAKLPAIDGSLLTNLPAAPPPSLQTLTDGATITLDYSISPEAQVTLAGNRTLLITNLPAAATYVTLVVIQDATGGRTLALPAGTKVINGGAGSITLTTAGASIDILSFRWDGTTLFLTYGKNYN